MKPPIQYFGAKGSIADRVVSLMPEHEGYIEPFGGSLSVLLSKTPARVEVANDLDGRLMTFWRVLRERPEELHRAAELTPHSRAELQHAQNHVIDTATMDELEVARLVWVMLTQGRSRTLQRTGWRFFTDGGGRTTSSSFATYMAAYRDRLLPAAERIRDVTLECRPALDIIRQYGAHERNLLYVDPPYVHGTRRGGRYTHEMDATEHRDLAAALHECKAMVMLSGYASDLYAELYPDWHQIRIAAHTGNGADTNRCEVIWSNRELDQPLFGFDIYDHHTIDIRGARRREDVRS